MSNSAATFTSRQEPKAPERDSLFIIVFMDLIGFSTFLQEEQRNAAEQLNTAMEKSLIAQGIRQVVGRLPTGDGAALLIQPGNRVTRDAVLQFAVNLLSEMHGSKLFLRVGIHEGAVLRATLGTSGSQNFCSSAMNLTQRIMDSADGHETEHNRQKKVLHAIACSSDFVLNLLPETQKHFGKEFNTQAKHGQHVKLRFYYGERKDIPAEPHGERVAGPIAAFDWKIEKLRDRGLDFYAFGQEKSPEDKERLHKQLVRKNFDFVRKEFRRADVPTEYGFNASEFEKENLGLYPVKLVLGSHPDFGIGGPALDLGDLAYGVYRATFYFSIFERLESTVRLMVEVCHGTCNPADPHAHFNSINSTRPHTCQQIVGDEGVNDDGQKRNGWLSRSFEFRYDGQPFVQLRFMLVDENIQSPVTTFKRLGRVPDVWFYKVHLRLIGDGLSTGCNQWPKW